MNRANVAARNGEITPAVASRRIPNDDTGIAGMQSNSAARIVGYVVSIDAIAIATCANPVAPVSIRNTGDNAASSVRSDSVAVIGLAGAVLDGAVTARLDTIAIFPHNSTLDNGAAAGVNSADAIGTAIVADIAIHDRARQSRRNTRKAIV